MKKTINSKQACYISRAAYRQWMLIKKSTTYKYYSIILNDCIRKNLLYAKILSLKLWLTWPHPTQTPYSRFSVPAYCYHYLIGYDTNFHVSVRPRMYLSTTISLSVILRLLNSKTCKICKQKNSQQKKFTVSYKKKFVDEQSRVCIHLPTPINPPRKFYPFADFLKFEEIAYY